VEPNKLAATVHNRMPLVLPPDSWDVWLANDPLGEQDAARLLVPAKERALKVTQVSTEVNNVRNDGPELVEAV
jgi:putative SOS response-associated peptidase YedK